MTFTRDSDPDETRVRYDAIARISRACAHAGVEPDHTEEHARLRAGPIDLVVARTVRRSRDGTPHTHAHVLVDAGIGTRLQPRLRLTPRQIRGVIRGLEDVLACLDADRGEDGA